MSKCDKCNRNVTKTKPGVECSKCEKLVHLTSECSGLTTKQRAALRSNEGLEWTCEECLQLSPRRRSIVVPDEDIESDKEDEAAPMRSALTDYKRLMNDISIEMEKAMKRELKDLTKAFQFHTEKMDEILENIETFKATTQELRRKNIELTNKNNELELRVGVLEQRIEDIEQRELCNSIEIANIPHDHGAENVEIVKNIAKKIGVPHDEPVKLDISSQPGNKERPGKILLKYDSEYLPNKWLESAKSNKVTVGDVIPEVPDHIAKDSIIYIREVLTPYKKTLLWKAKQQLKASFKFIWCKKGIIRVKKGDVGKPTIIRSELDIKKLLTKCS